MLLRQSVLIVQIVLHSDSQAGAELPAMAEVAASHEDAVVGPPPAPLYTGRPSTDQQEAPAAVHQPEPAAEPAPPEAPCPQPDQALCHTSRVNGLLEAGGGTSGADRSGHAVCPEKPAARAPLQDGSGTGQIAGAGRLAARRHLPASSASKVSRPLCTAGKARACQESRQGRGHSAST